MVRVISVEHAANARQGSKFADYTKTWQFQAGTNYPHCVP